MIETVRADYRNHAHAAAVVALLNVYASDPMGGGEPLSDKVCEALPPGLANCPTAFSVLAYDADKPVGLANCFFGFSTFAAKPLVNIHDMVVVPDARGTGVVDAMFDAIESIARAEGACKVTLEVLSGNDRAKAVYARRGYGDFVLDPAMGHALFWQKRLAA